MTFSIVLHRAGQTNYGVDQGCTSVSCCGGKAPQVKLAWLVCKSIIFDVI